MIDPASVLITGVLFGAGWLAGRIGRRRGTSQAALPTQPFCSCGHGLALHDRKAGTCTGQTRRAHYTSNGDRNGHEWVPCGCVRYTGPEHIADVWAPPAIDQ